MPQCSACERDLPDDAATCPFCGGQQANLPYSDQLLDRLLALLANQQKLEAVKLIRAELNLSLAEAKRAIDQLEAELATSAASPATAANNTWQAEARELLLQGKSLQAIKLCKERSGCSLQKAKEQVDALAAQHGLRAKSGCFGILLFAAFVALAFVIRGLA